MNNNFDKLDKLLKSKLENHSVAPPNHIWLRVKSKVFFKNLMSLKFIAGSKLVTLSFLAGLVFTAVSLLIFNEPNILILQNQYELNLLEQPNDHKKTYQTKTHKDGDLEIEISNKKNNENKAFVNQSIVDKTNSRFSKSFNSNIDIGNKVNLNDDSSNHKSSINYFDKSDVLFKKQNPIGGFVDKQETKDSLVEILDVDSKSDSSENDTVSSNPDLNPILSPLIKPTQWSVKLWESPEMVFSKLSSKDLFISSSYLEKRKKNESIPVYYSRGIEFCYQAENKLLFQSGLNYYESGEKAMIDNHFIVYDSIGYYSDFHVEFKWQTFYDSFTNRWDSFVMPFVDSLNKTIYDTQEVTKSTLSVNKYKYIEIPILAGYSFSYKKFDFDILTGISAGYLVKTEGKMPDPYSSESPDISATDEFIRRWMISYILRAGISYPINSSIRVYIEPAFKYNLNSIIVSPYPFKQKYYSSGLHMGIIYKF